MYRKKWQKNRVTGEIINAAAEHLREEEAEREHRPQKTVWQRDIVAAKCIFIKGKY